MDAIGGRVQAYIAQYRPDDLHRDIAESVSMTPDAFSRSLSGARRFTSVELARVADRLDADLHWFITGERDPHRLVVAARHHFDHLTGDRTVPGRDADLRTINDIALAYRQAFAEHGDVPELPAQLVDVTGALGVDFVRPFVDRLEQRLGVDVVRIAELSTAYSATLCGRHLIVVPASGNWFRENWDLAHELGHLVLRHHDEGLSVADSNRHEAAANAFAAEMLLPRTRLDAIDWSELTDAGLAETVWDLGVSTEALARRLKSLSGSLPPVVNRWSRSTTQALLRRKLNRDRFTDVVTARMNAAAHRRFPAELEDAHLAAIADGRLGKETLAWMLGVDPQALEVETPHLAEVDLDELAAALGH